jgi:hypothetical protein
MAMAKGIIPNIAVTQLGQYINKFRVQHGIFKFFIIEGTTEKVLQTIYTSFFNIKSTDYYCSF